VDTQRLIQTIDSMLEDAELIKKRLAFCLEEQRRVFFRGVEDLFAGSRFTSKHRKM
jgi:RNA-binding protein YhbY